MKFYKNLDIDGSLIITVAANNSMNVDGNGLIYSKQNTYGTNYIQYNDVGLSIFNSTSTGASSLSFANNQLYVGIDGGSYIRANPTTITMYSNAGGAGGILNLTSSGFAMNAFNTGIITMSTPNYIIMNAGGSGQVSLKTSTISSGTTRQIQFPNADGTIALTSDIPNNIVVWGSNTAGSMLNGYTGNSVLYNSTDTPDGGIGFSWNAALDNTSGIYSAQTYIGCSAGTGQAFDSMWYRANQQGGSGWPTPWYQIASRAWVGAQGYLTSFTETDPVYNAAVPNIFMYKAGIPTGVDLNTYIVTGFYAATNAVSGTVVNAPQTGSPFILEVIRNPSLYTLQRATYNGNVSYRRFSGDGGTTWSSWSKTVGSTEVILNQTSLQSSANFNISGYGQANQFSVGIAPTTSSSLIVGKNITGAASSFGIRQEGVVQSDVSNGYGFYNLSGVAAGFALGDYNHFVASQGTIGAGSTISRQLGFRVASNFIGATSNYGFYGEIPIGTNRWNIYMAGTADNFMAGALGIGSSSLSSVNFRISKSLTGAVTKYGIFHDGVVQSDVTTQAIGHYSAMQTAAASFTLGAYTHHYVTQGTIGAGSSVTTQTGYLASSAMVTGTNIYGFRGNIIAATGRYNTYNDGTAQNYFAGNVGMGVSTPLTALHLGASSVLRLDGVTSTLLKTNSSGDVVAAVAGTDYLTTATLPTISSGTYTPTITWSGGTMPSVLSGFTYQRVDSIVTVTGIINGTFNAGNNVFNLTLPIASTLATDYDLSGTMSGTSIDMAYVTGDTSTNTAKLVFNSAAFGAIFGFTFSYKII